MGYNSFYNRKVKRVLDFLISIPLLAIAVPFMAVIGVAILVDDGGPILYRPVRGGYGNKPFRIYKFRTMVKDADKVGGGTTALNDSRITRRGSFLRKSKLDEIPQLFNIARGEMSFVGPRPELLQYTKQYKGEEKLILKVRPGITDYSSIAFINLDELVGAENADDIYEKKILKKKNRMRIKYARTVSFKTDCHLFFLTIGKVVEKIVHIF